MGSIVLCIFLAIIAYIVYRHCGRPTYIGERAALQEANRIILLNTYHAEPFTCITKDNIMLDCLIIKRPNAPRVIIMCHGYNRSKEFMLPVVEMFPQDTIVLFDFRAHGKSSGNIVSFSINESRDVHTIIEFITEKYNLQNIPIYGIGVSMGAATLVKAAYEGAPFKALVLDSSFAVFGEQLKHSWKAKTKLPHFFLNITQWAHEYLIGAPSLIASPEYMIPELTIPVCIIHAEGDELVPFTHAQRLYKAAPGKKQLLVLKSNYHARNFTEFPLEYKRCIDEFLDSATL